MKKHIVQLKNWILILVVLLSFESLSKDVKAASGNVYSCQIARTYEHPVTGKVEDSGGSSSKATGQGMVEGAISSKGLLEVTDSGGYYLTFRISLVDYTSDLSFSVQKRGASGFQTQSVTQTATGKDNNGINKRFKDQTFIPRQHHPLFHVRKTNGKKLSFFISIQVITLQEIP